MALFLAPPGSPTGRHWESQEVQGLQRLGWLLRAGWLALAWVWLLAGSGLLLGFRLDFLILGLGWLWLGFGWIWLLAFIY